MFEIFYKWDEECAWLCNRNVWWFNAGTYSQPEIFWVVKGKLWRGKTFLFILMRMTEQNVCTGTILVYLYNKQTRIL